MILGAFKTLTEAREHTAATRPHEHATWTPRTTLTAVPVGDLVADKVVRPATRPYRLVRPCPKCPFRSDVEPYITPGRVEQIARDVQGGAVFYCHETTVPDDDDDGAMTSDRESAACAGSLILMERTGAPNQAMRIAERLGLYDPERLDMEAPVHESWVAMQEHFNGDEAGEPCSVVGPGCEAPAGFLIGGAVVSGTDFAENECASCGQPVCDACLCDEGVCEYCAEADE